MTIEFPDSIRWQKLVGGDSSHQFSKEKLRKIKRISNQYSDIVSAEIVSLTDEILDWFTPLYNDFIGKKENANLYNIAATTIHSDNGRRYYALVLSEDCQRVGAVIFSDLPDKLNIAYRVLPHKWKNKITGANPALYTEWLLEEYANKSDKLIISHGKDRNPYGINSNIGLAAFKLSIGCTPMLPTKYQKMSLELGELKTDALVFSETKSGSEVIKGTLYCSEVDVQKYQHLTKYPDQVEIQVVTRD